MCKGKMLVILGIVGAAILVASVAGVALAQTTTPPKPDPSKTLMGRVATILGIDQAKLQSAFDQANRDMQNEALDNRLKALVSQGKMTQQQADDYMKWWQSRPNVMPPNPMPMPRFNAPRFRAPMMPVLPPKTTPPAPGT